MELPEDVGYVWKLNGGVLGRLKIEDGRRTEETNQQLKPLPDRCGFGSGRAAVMAVKNAVGFGSGNSSGPCPVESAASVAAKATTVAATVVVTAARFVSTYGSRFSERYNLR